MPPRHAYWTIIVDDQPTSFRAHDVEELLPTFNRLREKHPNAQLKWFERGQLWESRDAAREQGFGRGERRWEGPRPSQGDGPAEPKRDAKWRPGGEHRDPRQKYKDAKKAKWDRYKQRIRSRWEEQSRPRPDDGEYTPPQGDPMRPKLTERSGDQRPWRDDKRGGDTGGRGGWRPREERRRPDRRDEWRPREEWRSQDERRTGDRRSKPWSGKPGGPAARKPWSDRPPASGKPRGDKPAGGRKPWGSKPAGAGARKPWGGKPAAAGGRKPWGGKAAGSGTRKAWGKPAGSGGYRKKPFGASPPRGTRGPKKRREDEE
jgi:23S rRNA pseudouridine2605 synthase